MNEELKKILKKYFFVGFLLSLLLLIANSFIRIKSFPPVELARALIYYIPFLIIVSLSFLFLGFIHYKLKSKQFNNYLFYSILIPIFLVFVALILLLLYLMNFALSFLGSF